MRDDITFKGVTYTRWPNHPERSKRCYYWPPRGSNRDALHREIWKDAHGPIPDGHVIHHIDHDPLNNDVANLACMAHGDHTRHHRTDEDAERDRAHLDRHRDRAAEWHRSPEGRDWHSRNARASAERRRVERHCEVCGKAYQTSHPERSKYCSVACQQRDRRRTGKAGVRATCPVCGATFVQNYDGRPETCGRACGQHLRRMRREGLRPDG